MSKLFRLLLPIIVILLLLPGCGKIKPKIVVDLKPLVKSAEYKEGTENAVIFKAMEGEINRSISSLKIDDSAPKLYFLSYLIQDSYSYTTQYGIGAKTDQYEMNLRLVFADVRVGDYKYDNFVHPSERDFYDPEITKFENITSGLIVPYDNNEKALRHALWLLTDVNYKKAVIEYTKKKSKEKTEAKVKEDKDLEDFTQEEVKSLILEETEPSVDKEYWDSYINAGAQELKNYPFLLSASLIFTYDHNKRYFMDSEGRKIQFSGDRISIIVTVETKAEDGMNLSNGFVLHGFVKEDFPSADDFVKLIKEKCDLLQKMQNAPIVDPYSGPVLIMAPAAGVFFHEVLGHRLESQRIRSVKEAETFKDMVGKKIINQYLNIFDDPTLKYFND
ncbi:MAG: metallopeptidase TldD-related protein, partial [bacterium]|nr:metallopeptidase TldD-related protein [bacterium]